MRVSSKRTFSVLALVLLATTALLGACAPRAVPTGAMSSGAPQPVLRVGDPAPDFTLPDQNRQQVALSSFRGKTVQVAFYVWAFSGG